MACYKPLQAWIHPREKSKTGKNLLVFSPPDIPGRCERIYIPCGRCIGCRLEKSRQWAMRCVHEASLYRDNVFITLTYDDDHLPENASLVKKHFQDFMKRLRKKYGNGIRYYHCGEYGGQNGRPHYHACIFNLCFPDAYYWGRSDTGHPIYRSESLEKLWKFGFSYIGEVNFESAAYIARYVTKKIYGTNAIKHYSGRIPEYTTMSNGIGRDWFAKYSKETYNTDCVIMRDGKKLKPPKYYDKLLEKIDPELYNSIKAQRKEALLENEPTAADLKRREKAKLLKTKRLKRSFERKLTDG